MGVNRSVKNTCRLDIPAMWEAKQKLPLKNGQDEVEARYYVEIVVEQCEIYQIG